MKARVVHSIYIKAQPQQVFTYLQDLRYHLQWDPTLQRVEPMIALEQGSEYHSYNWVFNMKLTGNVRVQKLVKNRQLDLVNTTGMLVYHISFRLAPDDTGTVLICDTRVSTNSKAFSFAKPMMQLLARRELQADLNAIKKMAEQGID